MKKIKNMTFAELREKYMTAQESLSDIYIGAANRELNADEQMKEINLKREISEVKDQMDLIAREKADVNANAMHRRESMNRQFRELLRENMDGKSKRTVLLAPGKEIDGSTENTIGNVSASGAIMLTIHDVIPTLNEGLGLAKGVRIVTGVTGNEVWPVSINDVEMEEPGEIEALNEQNLDFDKITPMPKRAGLQVNISNAAIDNAAFDLLAFVQSKFAVATKKYLAKKLYSQAAWTGVKGPFSGLTEAGTISLGADAYKNILKAVATFTDKGFDSEGLCLVVDATTEAELKATPKAEGQGGFIIENGKLAGYDYVVSHYVNTKLQGGKLVATDDKFIGIGYFDWLAIQQHGEVRFTIDPTTLAHRNITRVILNTEWSVTDLSAYVNGANGKTQGFALYKVDSVSTLSAPSGVAVATAKK